MRFMTVISVLLILLIAACSSYFNAPDLGGLYNSLVQNESPYRNPVVLIPGLVGTRLVDSASHAVVWGVLGSNTVNPSSPYGAKLVSLPMENGRKLSELNDGIVPDGALDRVVMRFFGYPLELNTYAHILEVLGVGGYRGGS